MKEGNIKSKKRFEFLDNPKISLGPHNEIVNFLLFLTLLLGLEIPIFYLLQRNNQAFHYYFLLISFLFFLSLIIYIILNIYVEIKKMRIRNFLQSSRIIIAWKYKKEEWVKIKRKKWEKSRFQVLAFSIASLILFALIAALIEIIRTYANTGTSFSIVEILLFSLLVCFAMTIAKYISRNLNKSKDIGREIAIGNQEIYFNGDYIKSDNQHWLCDAHLTDSEPHRLVIEVLDSFKENRDVNDEISVRIPDRLLPKIRSFLEDKSHSYQ